MSKSDRKLRRHLARRNQQSTGAKRIMSEQAQAQAEPTTETKPFSKAETKRLVNLADVANRAIRAHADFVEFLSEQHEAPPNEGWQLGDGGFVRQVEAETPQGGKLEESEAIQE